MTSDTLDRFRSFLKDGIRQQVDFAATEQSRGLPPPPVQKPFPADALRIELPAAGQWAGIEPVPVEQAIRNRESRRRYGRGPLSLDRLAFLLWATQGIRKQLDAGTALRTVPSAGARHAFETYLCVVNVQGLEPGVYRYLPIEHQLLNLSTMPDITARVTDATLGQAFAGRSAVTFVWAALPARMEWRYGLASHKVIALDAGHVCQNLYLACEAAGAGTCAIAAYDQEAVDRLIGVDGRDEFAVYLAPVGMKQP
jgi:SagB-type dehydrogenase family enzyme